MPVLFRRPGPGPDGPGGGARARLVAYPVQSVEHCLVCGQRFLRDHVAHQAHEIVVRDFHGARPKFLDFVVEALGSGVREEILRLPVLLHGFEKGEDVGFRPTLQRFKDFYLLRRHGVSHLDVHLPRGTEWFPAIHPSWLESDYSTKHVIESKSLFE